MRRVLLPLVVLAALASCASAASVPPDSGIQGIVTLGGCPGPVRKGGCPARPFSAKIRVLQGGKLVATVRADQRGRFRVPLAPGRYVLDPLEPAGTIALYKGRIRVTVRPHAFTLVRIAYDDGLR